MEHIILFTTNDVHIIQDYVEQIINNLCKNTQYSHQQALDYATRLKNYLKGANVL